MAFNWIPLDTGYFNTNDYVTTYEPKENNMNETKMNDKFFIYTITKTSVKRYFVTNDHILPLYKKVDTIIRTSTNQKCIFLNDGTSFLWEDIDELTQNPDL
jgi:hypothetical protein